MTYVYIEKSGRFVVDISKLNCFDQRAIKTILDRDPNSIIDVYYRTGSDDPLSYLFSCSLN